jgi:hypothetical protein
MLMACPLFVALLVVNLADHLCPGQKIQPPPLLARTGGIVLILGQTESACSSAGESRLPVARAAMGLRQLAAIVERRTTQDEDWAISG